MTMKYSIGVDVGLYSVGLSALRLGEHGEPVRILKAMSYIHDSGVDPSQQKVATSRKSVSGVARRTRRMRRRRKLRLSRLDNLLSNMGYPLVELPLKEPFGEWLRRAELADGYIVDDELRKEYLSIAIRHIARHRGWRNPYKRVETLFAVNLEASEQFNELCTRAENLIKGYSTSGLTTAQIVRDCIDFSAGLPSIRLRHSTKENATEALLPARLMQEDNARELRAIFAMQRVKEDEQKEIIRSVFSTVSPKGSAESRVGIDPLTDEPRALKASLAFQKYRIISTISNLRIRRFKTDGSLTVSEKQKVYEFLADEKNQDDLTWGDIAELLNIERRSLVGVGNIDADGERISNRPPRMTTLIAIHKLSDEKLRKKLEKWWGSTALEEHESMVRLLGNTIDIDKVQGLPEYAAAVDFIDSLDDSELTKLDKISLPSGRAAYSVSALDLLSKRMLETEDDLHAARKAVFDVDDFWRPAADPVDSPLGNPAVDRVLKIVNRFLINCENRWGDPERINIENTRQGFTSVKTAREIQKDNDRRAGFKQDVVNQLKNLGIDDIHEYDIRRLEAVQRQNSQCLYCGRQIAFKTCEMDHIVPRKGAGSTNTRTNLAAVCVDCNRLKSNIPFAAWCQQTAAQQRGVSLKEAINRVDHFIFQPHEYSPVAQRNYKQAVIVRLKQKNFDDPMDARSMESVSWMADELHKRIDWYFNSDYYTNHGSGNGNKRVSVSVYNGSATAMARRLSGIEGQIHFIGSSLKTRLDRRHHAVDASVIAMMSQGVSQILEEKRQLRTSQRILGRPESGMPIWHDYPLPTDSGYMTYMQWLRHMHTLLDLLNDALDNDRIPVLHLQRLSLGNSVVHDDTIHPLKKMKVSDVIDAETIRRASTPALYCALTRCSDYDSETGLPENPNRVIEVNGSVLGSDDSIGFFASTAAQITVRNGSAEIGSAIHHARLYKCWMTLKSGKKKIFYGMIRVFQTDLRHAHRNDLFSYPLPEQSISMRYGEHRTVNAILTGNAEYVGPLCVDDELYLDLASTGKLSGQIGEFAETFTVDATLNPEIVNRWVVGGFYSDARLRMRPLYFSAEGLEKVSLDNEISVKKIVDNPGWLPSIDSLAKYHPQIIHRNALGEPRFSSKAGLPVSYKWDS